MTTVESKLKELMDGIGLPEQNEKRDRVIFRSWFIRQFAKTDANRDSCSLEDFAVYFLSAVRQQTEVHLRTLENSSQPSQAAIRPNVHCEENTSQLDNSTSNTNNKSVRLASTSLDGSADWLQSRASTPIRRSGANNSQHHHSATPNTPNSCEKQTSARNSNNSSSLCLGDFLVLNTPNSRSNKKKPNQQNSCDTPNAKPKKRVVPTNISNRAQTNTNNSPFGISSSSFSNENNILDISHNEIDDKNKCQILEARRTLKVNASDICKELQKTTKLRRTSLTFPVDEVQKLPEQVRSVQSAVPPLAPVKIETVSNRALLQRLADIYAVLIDLNFCTNLLNELSFLFNLINVDTVSTNHTKAEQTAEQRIHMTILNVLADCTSSVCFALLVLEQLQHLLSLLDVKSLGVVLQSERLDCAGRGLKACIEASYQQKLKLEALKSPQHISFRDKKSLRNVHYNDKDSRQHFASNNEFGAFKTQRDLFFKALKLWEENHLHPMWSFFVEISPIIRELFRQSEHSVNMTHFAKLFVSQMLISAIETTSPEEIGIEMDLRKFSKLAERLTAPSNFSVDYQFPHNQAFFRDFIGEARSIPFAEHLKMAIYAELISLNDSTFDQMNLNTFDKVDDSHEVAKSEHTEFIVPPSGLASMIILAKFLGFTTSLPFTNNNQNSAPMATNIEEKQIIMRNMFQPDFNVCRILRRAITGNQLLITLPWLVQYLAMLDNITLQLDHYAEMLQELFGLYMRLGTKDTPLSSPTSIFIVRCCLGWLFETKPILAEQYYSFRIAHQANLTGKSKRDDEQEMRILIASNLATELPADKPLHVSSVMPTGKGKFNCILESKPSSLNMPDKASETVINTISAQSPNATLESVLNVACPFLADFRVSIMSTKHATAKNASRSGRYRHITTRITNQSFPEKGMQYGKNSLPDKSVDNTQNVQKQSQNMLIETFLHSQNASMRRLIEFLTERTFKSVVKDAQRSILIPSKAAADFKVNEITAYEFNEVSSAVSTIYAEARSSALQKFNCFVEKKLHERIEKALDSLLPADTIHIVRQTYFFLIHRSCIQKIEQWRNVNLNATNNFYCNDLQDVTQKICKANKRERTATTNTPTSSSELKIVTLVPSVSELIDELQYWLHCTSMRPELMTSDTAITEYLQRLPFAFGNILPAMFYRLIGSGIVQLLQHIIARHPLYLTQELINAACKVWVAVAVQLEDGTVTTEISTENTNADDHIEVEIIPTIYDSLISSAFIDSLGTCRLSYSRLQHLLIEMIAQHVITIDFLNRLFMTLFKLDWHPDVFSQISILLRAVAQADNAESDKTDEKSQLFMDVLADFSQDVDDF